MPGPCATKPYVKREEAKPHRKSAKRLQARKDAFNSGSAGSGLLNHMPGSQNRKK